MQITRLFTQASTDAYDQINFRQPEARGDSFDVPLEHPDNWSPLAVEILADEAAACALPRDLNAIEENTVPSWLWRQARAKAVGGKESSVAAIFDRVVGAATYQGWKQKLFTDETAARAFFDEARYALAQRFIAIEPKLLAVLGLNWAYGVSIPTEAVHTVVQPAINITNSMIDVVVSGRRDRVVLGAWSKIIGARNKTAPVNLHFSDTEAQWETPMHAAGGVRLNLMGFRHNDGSVNIAALRQAVRLAVMLLDLSQDAVGQALAIGYANLAPLLMALALPYDSEAGRATAAAISAIISAEAYATSAQLAALRGASPAFAAEREASLRALRNHRRAAYGEHNDYEKISVTPLPLAVRSCPDLALTAAARSAWDHALELAQAHGLRHTQVTSLFTSHTLTLFMESETDGIAPMRSLVVLDGDEEATRRLLHPSVGEALARLGSDTKKIAAVGAAVTGHYTLEKAPAINHASLRARGFTAEVLERLEAYLPQASNLRHVFTPWVLGVEFCRTALKVPAAKIENLRFNLLAHLGFSESDIAAANLWCFGADTIDPAGLNAQQAAIFATASSLSAEAQIRMAAAVQGFMSGETALRLKLPLGLAAEQFEKLVLDAWRRGVKAVAVVFDADMPVAAAKQAASSLRRATPRKLAPPAFLHSKSPVLPKRQSRGGTHRLGHGLTAAKAKSRTIAKSH